MYSVKRFQQINEGVSIPFTNKKFYFKDDNKTASILIDKIKKNGIRNLNIECFDHGHSVYLAEFTVNQDRNEQDNLPEEINCEIFKDVIIYNNIDKKPINKYSLFLNDKKINASKGLCKKIWNLASIEQQR